MTAPLEYRSTRRVTRGAIGRRELEEGEQGGEQGPARGVPPLLRVGQTHPRSVRTRPDTAQAFDNFNGSSQLTMVWEGGALCRPPSIDVFCRTLKSSDVA